MTVGLDPDNVLVGAANGAGIYIAPVGTARPTEVTDDFAAPWVSLGYLSEDAVKVGMETDSEDIMAWQVLSPVDTVLKGKKLTLGLTMIEASGANVALYFDTTAPTVDGDGSFAMDIPTAPAGTKYAVAVDAAYGGTIIRFFFNRATLKSNDEIALGNTKAIPFGVTLSCLDDAGVLGHIQRGVVSVGS